MARRSYPIWNDVTACIYNSGKSWGAIDTAEVGVKVGTSGRNSNDFVRHVTWKRQRGPYTIFKFGVDLLDGNGFHTLKTGYLDENGNYHEGEPPEDSAEAA